METNKHIPIGIIAPMLLRSLVHEAKVISENVDCICVRCDYRFTHHDILMTEYDDKDVPVMKDQIITLSQGKKWVMVSPCCRELHIFGFDYDF